MKYAVLAANQPTKPFFSKFNLHWNTNLQPSPKKIDFLGTCVGRRELYNNVI